MTARATLLGVVALLAVVAPAAPALAQDAPGPIALPYQPQPQTMPWTPSRRAMPLPLQRVTVRDRPTLVDELGVTPELPPAPAAVGYDTRIRASSDAAEGLQGPLDGAWIVSGPDGRALLVLQLVDPGDGSGRLEGAWRDLMTPDGVEPVGLIDSLARGPGDLTIRFQPRGGAGVTLQVRPNAAGDWSGQLTAGEQVIVVSMKPA